MNFFQLGQNLFIFLKKLEMMVAHARIKHGMNEMMGLVEEDFGSTIITKQFQTSRKKF